VRRHFGSGGPGTTPVAPMRRTGRGEPACGGGGKLDRHDRMPQNTARTVTFLIGAPPKLIRACIKGAPQQVPFIRGSPPPGQAVLFKLKRPAPQRPCSDRQGSERRSALAGRGDRGCDAIAIMSKEHSASAQICGSASRHKHQYAKVLEFEEISEYVQIT